MRQPRLLLSAFVLVLSAQLAAQAPPDNARAAALRDPVDLYRKAVDADHLRGAVLYAAHNGTVALHDAVRLHHHASGAALLKAPLLRMASHTTPRAAPAL